MNTESTQSYGIENVGYLQQGLIWAPVSSPLIIHCLKPLQPPACSLLQAWTPFPSFSRSLADIAAGSGTKDEVETKSEMAEVKQVRMEKLLGSG